MRLRPLLFTLCLCALLAGASVAAARDAANSSSKNGSPLAPITGLTTTGATETTISIDWNAPTMGARNLDYDLFLDGKSSGTTTQTHAQFTGLQCATSHVLGVRARKDNGRVSPIAEIQGSTTACPDRMPPSAPAGLAVVGVSETGFTVTWQPSTDNVGVAGYDVSLDGGAAVSTTSTSRAFTGLSCGKTHRVAISARDAAGNRSGAAEIEAKTAKCPDLTPPSAPTGLTVADRLETGFTIVWQASTDDEGVAGYDVSLDDGAAESTTATSKAFSGLSCGSTHKVSIVARDAAGNRSTPAEVSATTTDCAPPPPPSPPPPTGANLFVSPGGTDTIDRWHHMATTYDGSVLRLYVDGIEVGRREIVGFMQNSTGFVRMGGNKIFTEWYAGLMDEVRLFGRALSPEEIRAEMNSAAPRASGLAAAYNFNEGAGVTAADSSPNGNAGFLTGATWTTEGKFGGGISFDGIDDMVSVVDAKSLDFVDGMTLSGWVKPKSSNGWQTLVTKEADTEEVYGLWPSTADHVPSGHVTVGVPYEARGPAPLTMNDCRATPCSSMSAAYLAAQRGEVVEVAEGTYRGDADGHELFPAALKSGDGVIVIRPAAGAKVTLLAEAMVDGSHIEFRDLRMDNGWQTSKTADDVTFRNVSSAHLFIFSSSNVNVIGGEIGPGQGLDFDSIIATSEAANPPTNILIKGVWFHDWFRPAGSDFHTECLQIGSAVNLTISGNRFQRCATHDVFIRSWGTIGTTPSPLKNIVIENNFFDQTLDGFFTLTVSNDLGTPDASVVVRNNSSLQAMNLDGANARIDVFGNIIGFQQAIGCTATSYAYNVIEEGEACSATDLVSPVGYVDRANLDLHLASGSAAIDAGNPAAYPSVDYDGDLRFFGGAPDAGADERG